MRRRREVVTPTLSCIVFLSRGFVRKEGWMMPSSSSIKCPRSVAVDQMRKLIAPLSNPCAALEGGWTRLGRHD